MNRSGLLIMLLFLGGVLALIWGCSESDNPVDGHDPNQPPDAGFEVAQKIFEDGVADFGEHQREISMYLIEHLAEQQTGTVFYKPLEQFGDSMTVTILNNITDGDWFVITVSATIIDEDAEGADTVLFQGVDSLRFHNPEGYTLQPDSTVDAVDICKHYDIMVWNSGDSVSAISHAAFAFTGDIMREFVADAVELDSLEVFIDDDRYICNFTATSYQTWVDVIIDEAVIQYGDCPPGGAVNIDATLSAECLSAGVLESATVEGAWTLDIVFDGGLATVTLAIGDQEWTTIDSCGGAYNDDFVLDSTFVEDFGWYVDEDMMSNNDFTIFTTLGALALIDSTLVPPTAGNPFISEGTAESGYSDGWHIFDIFYSGEIQFSVQTDTGMVYGTEYTHITVTDSIRIYNDGVPMQEPNADADSIQARNHYEAVVTSTLGDSLNMNGVHEINLVGTPWDAEPIVYNLNGATVDNTFMLMAWGPFAEDPCTLAVHSQCTMENIEFTPAILEGETADCPASGSVDYTVNVDMGCAQLAASDLPGFDGTWYMTQTFNGSTATWVYEYEGQTVTVTWDCDQGVSASPFADLLPRIRH